MEYFELGVPEALSGHVQCLWRLRDPRPPADVQTIYPDGRCEVIVHLGVPMEDDRDGRWQGQPKVLFAAQQRTAVRLRAAGPVDCIGIRLAPAASSCIGGRQLADLRDRIVALWTVAPGLADAMAPAAQALAATGNPLALWGALAECMDRHRIDPALQGAVAAQESALGTRRIEALAVAAGMPLRTFQSRFLAHVGLGAKEFARLVRLQAVIRALDRADAPLAGVAAEGGFADQAHATREVGRFTGLTPARLVAALRADREGATTVALAAAFIRGRAGREPGERE